MRGRLAASVVVVVVVGWVAVLVLTASVAVLVLAAVSLRGQTASTLAPVPGPVIGLRLPLYDYSCSCYRYLKLDPGQTQIAPDPAGTSNGIWSVKLYAAPGTADQLNVTCMFPGVAERLAGAPGMAMTVNVALAETPAAFTAAT